MSSIIELPPRRSVGVGAAALGLILIAASALSWSAVKHVAPVVILLVAGVPLVVFGVSRLVSKTPSLRATDAGAWFGGGSVIPWADVKQVFEADSSVKTLVLRERTSAISFEFHHRRTIFRAPIVCWLAAPFAVGDIDVASGASGAVLASRIEAMRVRAIGLEDGVPRGQTELPAARLVRRDD